MRTRAVHKHTNTRYTYTYTHTDVHACRRQRWGPDFGPTLLLHMLTIVADTLDEWLAAHKAAGCQFVPVEEVIRNKLYTRWV